MTDDGASATGMTLDEWMEKRDAELLANYTPGAYTNGALDKMGLSGVNTPNRSSIAGSRPESKKSNRTTFSMPEEDTGRVINATGTYTANLLATSVYSDPAHVGNAPRARQRAKKRPITSSTGISALTSASGGEESDLPKPLFLASEMNRQLVESKRLHDLESAWLREELLRKKKDMVHLQEIIKTRDEQVHSLSEQVEALSSELASQKSMFATTRGSFVPAADADGRPLAAGAPLSPLVVPGSPGGARSEEGARSPLRQPDAARLQSLSRPLRRREKSISDGIAKSYMAEIEWRAKQTPSAADYDTESCYKNRDTSKGGKFSEARPKSEMDWAVINAARRPGPGEYSAEPSDASKRIKGGRMSLAVTKTHLDVLMEASAKSPGPGAYKAAENHVYGGGKFSEARPKSEMDWAIIRASKTPGPGEYKGDAYVIKGGGKFSEARPKSEMDWALLNAQRSPGPGEYSADHDASQRLPGGRFSMAETKSALEWTIHRAKQTPGPGAYKINDDAVRKSGHTGKFPFVFKPTNPAQAHLAKGIGAVLQGNRAEKIAKMMMGLGQAGGGVAFGKSTGKKALKDMNKEEAADFVRERAVEVEKTRALLAKLEVKQQAEAAMAVDMAAVAEGDEAAAAAIKELFVAPPKKAGAKKMGSLLMKMHRKGDLDAAVASADAAIEQQGFLPAPAFDGPRAGHVFRSGHLGPGYYTDAAAPVVEAAAAAPAAAEVPAAAPVEPVEEASATV